MKKSRNLKIEGPERRRSWKGSLSAGMALGWKTEPTFNGKSRRDIKKYIA